MIEILARWLKQLLRLQPTGGCLGCKKLFWSYGAWERHLKDVHTERVEIK